MKSVSSAIVNFYRGNRIESSHRAHLCVVNAKGNLLYHIGDPYHMTSLRSSAKPFQAAAMVFSGAADRFNLTEKEIAICAGSHGGEDIHIETVTSILKKIHLEPSHLACGIHPPLDSQAALNLTLTGTKPSALHHNCSGKHAGMLATAVHLNQNIDTYLDPQGEVQNRITQFLTHVGGITPGEIDIAIDGCSAPVHYIPLNIAARAFARLIDPDGLDNPTASALNRVAAAMRKYPEMIAARQNRVCTELMRVGSTIRLTAKAGAEGVYAASWFDFQTNEALGLAVKIEDGAQRARDPLVIATLQQFNVIPANLPDNLIPFAAGPIKNWRNLEVGKIEVLLDG